MEILLKIFMLLHKPLLFVLHLGALLTRTQSEGRESEIFELNKIRITRELPKL